MEGDHPSPAANMRLKHPTKYHIQIICQTLPENTKLARGARKTHKGNSRQTRDHKKKQKRTLVIVIAIDICMVGLPIGITIYDFIRLSHFCQKNH